MTACNLGEKCDFALQQELVAPAIRSELIRIYPKIITHLGRGREH